MHVASLILLAILLFIPSFFNSNQLDVVLNAGPLWELLVYFIGSNFILYSILKLILIVLSGLILNAYITNNDLTSKISMLGNMFFVVLSFGLSSYVCSLNMLIVNLLLIFAFGQLMNIPKVEFTITPLYNASLITGFAAMFYLPILTFLPFFWLSLLSYRIGKWRDFVVATIGMVLPLFLIFNWYFFYDIHPELIQSIKNTFVIDIKFQALDALDLILFILWSGFILSILFQQINKLFERNIIQRQRLTVVEIYFLFSLIQFILFSDNWSELILIIVPSSIILAAEMNNIRKIKWYDWYLSVIVILTIVNRIMPLIDA